MRRNALQLLKAPTAERFQSTLFLLFKPLLNRRKSAKRDIDLMKKRRKKSFLTDFSD